MESRPLRVCVFCGGALGASVDYATAATELGKSIAKRGATLVFGGSTAGLMGVVARTVADAAGEDAVLNIVPEVFRKPPRELFGTIKMVKTVEERKTLMMESSDIFIALPGGPGTLEEISTVLAWRCYESGKPIGLLNIHSYYSKMLDFVDTMIDEGFMKAEKRDALIVSDNPDELITKLLAQEHLDKAKTPN